MILFQAYAFLLPAFSPRDRRVALPLMAMVPVLFAPASCSGTSLVLPAAVGFLQNFNHGQFDALVQARPTTGFTIMTLAAMGLLFQIPVGILALTRLGVVTPRQLRKNRRYAIVVIAILAALLPGVDPVTTLIEMVPMVFLYEFGILLRPVGDALHEDGAMTPRRSLGLGMGSGHRANHPRPGTGLRRDGAGVTSGRTLPRRPGLMAVAASAARSGPTVGRSPVARITM